MSSHLENEVAEVLREWMRNERRLGVPFWPVAPLAGGSASAAVAPALSRSAGLNATPMPVAAPVSAYEPRRPAPSATSAAPTSRPTVPTTAGSSQRTTALPMIAHDEARLPPLCDRELSPGEAAVELAKINEEFVRTCARCGLHAQGRQQTVFGVGNVRPTLMFIGEGPGADEDRLGEPFVGRAGQLLTKMIEAMTLRRDDVYIANIVKCRPPGNRTPVEDEMTACSPYLFRQIAILRPRVIVTLGAPASQTMLATKTPISRLRGAFHSFPPPPLAHVGLPAARLMPTFHPAYLLRSPQEKGKAWDDLKQVMAELGLSLPRR